MVQHQHVASMLSCMIINTLLRLGCFKQLSLLTLGCGIDKVVALKVRWILSTCRGHIVELDATQQIAGMGGVPLAQLVDHSIAGHCLPHQSSRDVCSCTVVKDK